MLSLSLSLFSHWTPSICTSCPTLVDSDRWSHAFWTDVSCLFICLDFLLSLSLILSSVRSCGIGSLARWGRFLDLLTGRKICGSDPCTIIVVDVLSLQVLLISIRNSMCIDRWCSLSFSSLSLSMTFLALFLKYKLKISSNTSADPSEGRKSIDQSMIMLDGEERYVSLEWSIVLVTRANYLWKVIAAVLMRIYLWCKDQALKCHQIMKRRGKGIPIDLIKWNDAMRK